MTLSATSKKKTGAMSHRSAALLTVAAAVLSCSCSNDRPHRKDTFPVTGRLVVDGTAPLSPVKVICHPADGTDQEHPTVSWCFTGEDGAFELSTYETGDGVPAGEYVLTFFWGQQNLMAMSYGGPDKLKGRYNDPQKPLVRFAVRPGGPADLGLIRLTAP